MVDDDALMRRSLTYTLEQAGYAVTALPSAEEALVAVDERPPDLVLLDIGLPGMDGLDALRRLRRRGDLPVIFVTARRRELEQVLGLELGADDYITKPFSPAVLVARVRAALRRARGDLAEATSLRRGELEIDPESHAATLSGQPLRLTPHEFKLLLALARRPGQTLSRDQLLDELHGAADLGGIDRSVDSHVKNLRRKLERDPERPPFIETVYGVGYRLVL